MRILVAGASGMLGHELFRHLRGAHEVRATLHRGLDSYARHGLFDASNAYYNVDAVDIESLTRVARDFRPDVIVNSIGIVKQLDLSRRSIPSLEINSLLPHRLALLGETIGARIVHFSTDCVFSGRKGMYSESDAPDAEDLYGRSKLLGELDQPHCLTLRTSFIGHELDRSTSLLEWFLAQKGTVRGFRRAIFSGFTTIEAARIVRTMIEKHADVHGVWHVSSEAIDKYALLQLIRQHYGLDTAIVPEDDFVCDRSLDSSRFRARFGYQPPSWESMIAEMSEAHRQERSVRR